MPNIITQMEMYRPESEQEAADQSLILECMRTFPGDVFTRESKAAHITSSGFLMNRALTRMLMIHHNIRGCWSWTGGHADGDRDLLAVALREAEEETGAARITPLTGAIASLDVLIVLPHVKNGRHVSAHLHLNTSYLLLCDEEEPLRMKPDENSGVAWMDIEALDGPLFTPEDRALYGKLISKARRV